MFDVFGGELIDAHQFGDFIPPGHFIPMSLVRLLDPLRQMHDLAHQRLIVVVQCRQQLLLGNFPSNFVAHIVFVEKMKSTPRLVDILIVLNVEDGILRLGLWYRLHRPVPSEPMPIAWRWST